MKKLLMMAVLFAAIFSTTTSSAQGGPGGDPAQMRQRMIEWVKPQLVEKTKISETEADKVLDIYIAAQLQRREIRMDNAMSDEDKAKKMAVIDEESAKKYKAIPLKDEQVKAVNDFFEDLRKNMRRQGGGNGN